LLRGLAIVALACFALGGAAAWAQLTLPGPEPAPSPSPSPGPSPGGSAGGGAPGKVFRDCADCPEMVVVPAGSFQMGGEFEKPVHQVSIEAFAVGKYEVTFAAWDACVAAGGCSHHPDDKGWGRGNSPVMNVSWDDAQEYVAWLSRKTGKSYRLPSEAEWEYAARGGTTTDYWWGNSASPSMANYGLFAGGRTQPVGSYPANPFGLYDVLGNVSEWTLDCWNDGYAGAPGNGTAWTTGDCGIRVTRGGGMGHDPAVLRSARRLYDDPDYRVSHLGFRLARTLP
jgi:formylglycine-generating enzyme required for sulfatase activity